MDLENGKVCEDYANFMAASHEVGTRDEDRADSSWRISECPGALGRTLWHNVNEVQPCEFKNVKHATAPPLAGLDRRPCTG